jgi:hypothetical protein
MVRCTRCASPWDGRRRDGCAKLPRARPQAAGGLAEPAGPRGTCLGGGGGCWSMPPSTIAADPHRLRASASLVFAMGRPPGVIRASSGSRLGTRSPRAGASPAAGDQGEAGESSRPGDARAAGRVPGRWGGDPGADPFLRPGDALEAAPSVLHRHHQEPGPLLHRRRRRHPLEGKELPPERDRQPARELQPQPPWRATAGVDGSLRSKRK